MTARMRVTALGVFEVDVNGRAVGAAVLKSRVVELRMARSVFRT